MEPMGPKPTKEQPRRTTTGGHPVALADADLSTAAGMREALQRALRALDGMPGPKVGQTIATLVGVAVKVEEHCNLVNTVRELTARLADLEVGREPWRAP